MRCSWGGGRARNEQSRWAEAVTCADAREQGGQTGRWQEHGARAAREAGGRCSEVTWSETGHELVALGNE